MNKSLIWLLTTIMAITFGVLLYFQITYLERMVGMRESQFSENVMRSLHATSNFLEHQEALHYLEDDINAIESNFLTDWSLDRNINGGITSKPDMSDPRKFPSPVMPLGKRYQALQDAIKQQYLYQKGLLDELILVILAESDFRAPLERADTVMIKGFLTSELAANGIDLPYSFGITDSRDNFVYQSGDFDSTDTENIYTAILFPNSTTNYKLKLEFPTKQNYIYSSVRFIIPTLALTVILLFIFIYTIVLIFRQKKISEMKSDFINNMTHELKTPISSISLAGQMLSDDSVRKSPQMLKHLSNVITEESKRLRFQVDKVLQLSVFDGTTSEAALKFTEFDANKVISNVVTNFKLRVEKHGGVLVCDLLAKNAVIYVDEMQFTNVINNLLENALKYRREDVEPNLNILTRDISNNRLEIRVRDNGIGIKKDDLKKIFDKFYRVSTGNLHNVKGFGLGLAYVKKMVSLFNGEIYVESEFGKWTEFIMKIPLSEWTSKKHLPQE